MHISEGVLPAEVLAGGAVLSLVGVALGLKRMDYDKLPQTAVLASTFFVASLIHFPTGIASVHLVLNGLCGLILGWTAFPAIFVGLVLQAVLFNHGGPSTLGVNTFNMAFPAVCLGCLCQPLIRSESPAVRITAELLAGAGSLLLSLALVALSLWSCRKEYEALGWLFVLAHGVVVLVEGIVTVFVVEFLRRVKPEVLSQESAGRG